MRLFLIEIKKMIVYQRGWLFLCVIFLFWMADLVFFDEPTQQKQEATKVELMYYLEQVSGKCTKESEKFISEQARQIAQAKSTLQRLQTLYFEGKLEKSEFYRLKKEPDTVLTNSDGFALLFEQYTYVRENMENRYFLYTNGWSGLLNTDEIDIPLVLILLLLITPVFCAESQDKMNLFLVTTLKGGKSSAVTKIILSIVTSLIISLSLSVLRYGFFALKYGLPHSDYPLQSISYFATSNWDISLGEAFFTITFYKLLGAVCFTVIILFISVCVKGYALSLFLCITTVILPNFLFTLSSTKYFLPSPLGFLAGTGYLKGTIFQRNLVTNDMIVIFQEISLTFRLTSMCILISGCVGMIWFVVNQHTNSWHMKKRHIKRLGGLVLCICIIFLTGCDNKSQEAILSLHTKANLKQTRSESMDYSFSKKQRVETVNYLFECVIKDEGKSQIQAIDKRDGDIIHLPMNPIDAFSEVGNCIYGQGDFIYYLKYDLIKSEYKETYSRFFIVQLNITDFSEKVVFEKQLNQNQTEFGVGTDENDYFWLGITGFFLNKDNIYFVRGDCEVVKVSRASGQRKTILSLPVGADLFFDGNYIYYLDTNGELVEYNLKTNMLVNVNDEEIKKLLWKH